MDPYWLRTTGQSAQIVALAIECCLRASLAKGHAYNSQVGGNLKGFSWRQPSTLEATSFLNSVTWTLLCLTERGLASEHFCTSTSTETFLYGLLLCYIESMPRSLALTGSLLRNTN